MTLQRFEGDFLDSQLFFQPNTGWIICLRTTVMIVESDKCAVANSVCGAESDETRGVRILKLMRYSPVKCFKNLMKKDSVRVILPHACRFEVDMRKDAGEEMGRLAGSCKWRGGYFRARRDGQGRRDGRFLKGFKIGFS